MPIHVVTPSSLSLSIRTNNRIRLRRNIRNLQHKVSSIRRTLIHTSLPLIAKFLISIQTTRSNRFLSLIQRQGQTTRLHTNPLNNISSFRHTNIRRTMVRHLRPSAGNLTLRRDVPRSKVSIRELATRRTEPTSSPVRGLRNHPYNKQPTRMRPVLYIQRQ